MNELLESFTSHLKTVLTRALCLAVEEGGNTIAPTHLLWALGTEEGSLGAEILHKGGATTTGLQRLTTIKNKELSEDAIANATAVTPQLSEESKTMIEKAVHAAGMHGHRYVGTEHLLHGIIEAKTPAIAAFLQVENVNEKTIRDNLATIFKTTANFPESLQNIGQPKPSEEAQKPCEECGQVHDDDHDEKSTALEYFTTELTAKNIADSIDPVIGRDDEIERVIAILARRTKNNPLLIGDPGVGKTAIAEGLAKRILSGNVPDAVARMHVHRLNMASMVAGTMYRGDFEARITQLLEELGDRKDIVLFIDEIHTIIGAGAASGSLDAANMLKPALARGELRCIGATTHQEYKKHIATDSALERRFATVTIQEPNTEETRTVLKGIARRYEVHHSVTYSADVLDTIIRIADRFMPNKQFPDKAIDILDEAGAYANTHRKPTDKHATQLRQLQNELTEIHKNKRDAIVKEKFPLASEMKAREEALHKQIQKLATRPTTYRIVAVTDAMVRAVASKMTGVPLAKLTSDDHTALRTLADRLKTHVIAQDDAVNQVANAMRRAKLGFASPNKPLASFLFAGPSGVGKTALAKALAIEMFGDIKSLVRFDMSEFAEGFSTSKLIGAPAGYVGYRESAKLTDALKEHPHCVILFDELEKAHRDVQSLLLQILDEGFITDATGTKVNFQNAVVIMTTNIGRDRFNKASLGFGTAESKNTEFSNEFRGVLEEHFRPELINRIGHVCLFKPLKHEDIITITKMGITDLLSRLERAKLSVSLPKKLAETLAREAKPIHGARDVQRVIEEKLEHEIARAVLKTKRPKTSLRVSLNVDGSFQIQ